MSRRKLNHQSCDSQMGEVEEKLAKEFQDYTDYRLSVGHGLHELHKVLKAWFGEVGVCCLPFAARNAPVDDYISWFEDEVNEGCDVGCLVVGR
jgi:hypothetical protein